MISQADLDVPHHVDLFGRFAVGADNAALDHLCIYLSLYVFVVQAFLAADVEKLLLDVVDIVETVVFVEIDHQETSHCFVTDTLGTAVCTL
jgi:hypothetical protein